MKFSDDKPTKKLEQSYSNFNNLSKSSVVVNLGIDPVYFRIIYIVNIMVVGIRPPFRSMMLTCCSMTDCTLEEFIKEYTPFLVAMLIILLLITYISQISLFLTTL